MPRSQHSVISHPPPIASSSPSLASSPMPPPTSSDPPEPSHKRPHSPTDSEDTDEDRVSYRKKKKKLETVKLHANWGRTLARLFDAYTTPSSIFHIGLKFDHAMDKGEDLNLFSKQQHAKFRSFQLITRHIPALDEMMCDCSDESREKLASIMKGGQDGARSDDTSALKRQVIEILRQTDPIAAEGLKPDVKATRGFNHPMTGRLLCPVTLDFDDPTIRDQLKSGEYKLSANEWPTFFYKDSKYNPDDGFEGLLKNELIVQCFKTIYFGRSSWDRPDGSSKSTRAPKAQLAEMESVTSRSIAYIATFLYQALSSRENNQKLGGPFELSAMYWHIVNLLEDDELKEESEDLLTWWNQRIFPDKTTGSVASAEVPEDPVAKLKAQKAARKRANPLQEATNH